MDSQSSVPEETVHHKEEERVDNGLPRVLRKPGIQSGQTAFMLVDLLNRVRKPLVFVIRGLGLVLSQLTLDLQPRNNEVDGIQGRIGDGCSCRAGNSMAERFERCGIS